jgi:hypothetical protein
MRSVEASTEADLTRKIAEDYRAKGYDVIVRPRSQELPEPLANFRPDIVARKDGETVIVEVKSRQALRREPHLEPMVRAVQQVPGARFELVIAKPDIASPLPEQTRPWRDGEAAAALDEATRLLEAGHPVAALLLGWAAAEAALRIVAAKENLKTERNDASYLLNRLVSEGALANRQYQSLRQALEMRNAVAHGLEPIGLKRSQVRALLRTVGGLLAPRQALAEAT